MGPQCKSVGVVSYQVSSQVDDLVLRVGTRVQSEEFGAPNIRRVRGFDLNTSAGIMP